jgi:hypothetical protein
VDDDEILDAIRVRVAQGRATDGRGVRPLPRPASPEAIEEAERIIGYPLPPLLRRIYAEIANGGIGPEGGIEGLPGGYMSDALDMLQTYIEYQRAEQQPDDSPPLPPGVLFFCDFGCAKWALLDCRRPQGQMWWWDCGDRAKINFTLSEWLAAWLAGRPWTEYTTRAPRLLGESWSRDEDDATPAPPAHVHIRGQLGLW